MDRKLLKQKLVYNENTGVFSYRYSRGRAKQGRIAGTVMKTGHIRIQIDGVLYLAHRLVWLWSYGKFPDKDIDHINGNPSDNRIENLRLCTKNQNQHNRKLRLDSRTGVKGVTISQEGKYKAHIQTDNKRLHLGTFNTLEEADNVCRQYREKQHGIFARHK